MKWKPASASLAILFIVFAANYASMAMIANAWQQSAIASSNDLNPATSPEEFAQANPPVVEEFAVWGCGYGRSDGVETVIAFVLYCARGKMKIFPERNAYVECAALFLSSEISFF
ncbi:MAG: hypothetical protein L0229_18880, partial [Blastocatellia bacterium]|nr:hypothetical protein [Blastocatellia bacterium]